MRLITARQQRYARGVSVFNCVHTLRLPCPRELASLAGSPSGLNWLCVSASIERLGVARAH